MIVLNEVLSAVKNNNLIAMNILHQPFKRLQITLDAKLKFAFLALDINLRFKILHMLHDEFQVALVIFLHFLVVIYYSNEKLFVLKVSW